MLNRAVTLYRLVFLFVRRFDIESGEYAMVIGAQGGKARNVTGSSCGHC